MDETLKITFAAFTTVRAETFEAARIVLAAGIPVAGLRVAFIHILTLLAIAFESFVTGASVTADFVCTCCIFMANRFIRAFIDI